MMPLPFYPEGDLVTLIALETQDGPHSILVYSAFLE